MTKMETIAEITAKLETLDEGELQELREVIDTWADDEFLPRPLTDEELALIEQSKEDFRLGRTLSAEEFKADIKEFVATLGAGKQQP